MKVGLDQTAAWILAVFGGLCVFGGFFAYTKIVVQNHTAEQEQELKALSEGSDSPDSPASDEDMMEDKVSDRDDPDSHDKKKDGHDSEDDMHAPEGDDTASLHEEEDASYKGEVLWGYEGMKGPDYWADLHPNFQLCRDGLSQSPINIQEADMEANLKPLIFRYGRARFHLIRTKNSIVGKVSRGLYLEIADDRFELRRLRFHTPSEHQMFGVPYDLEVQLHHENLRGEQLIVAVLGEEETNASSALNELLSSVPKQHHVEGALVRWNPLSLVPPANQRQYYSYKGSLTHPPCDEPVQWKVFKQPIPVKKSDVDQLVNLVAYNARPPKELGRRVLKVSI